MNIIIQSGNYGTIFSRCQVPRDHSIKSYHQVVADVQSRMRQTRKAVLVLIHAVAVVNLLFALEVVVIVLVLIILGRVLLCGLCEVDDFSASAAANDVVEVNLLQAVLLVA
jgi:hypothetical protein